MGGRQAASLSRNGDAGADPNVGVLVALVGEALGELEPAALEALVAHPERTADRIVATLAETAHGDAKAATLRLGGRPFRTVPAEEGRRRLDARTVTAPEVSPTLSSDEMAGRLGLKARETVIRWHRAGKLVGVEQNRRGLRFPAEQVDEAGLLVPGLVELKAMWPDDRALWWWLSTPAPQCDGERPIDLLRDGQSERVVRAARSFEEGHFQ